MGRARRWLCRLSDRAIRSTLGTRLLTAQALLLVAGAATCWVVASVIAPDVFRRHLQHAGVTGTPLETRHVEEAFAFSMMVSLLFALMAAVLIALAATWSITRRVQESIAAVVDSAAEVAAGHYSARISAPRLGGEFSRLAGAFNALAQRLEEVETTRRRMLADLAHEMRTPLATLDAHLEALEDQVRTLDGPTLAVLQSSTQRLSRLARDIGAVSKAQEARLHVDRSAIRPAQLIRAAMHIAQDRYSGKGVQLVGNALTDRAILVDPERMGQVLGNLLDNALRHTPPGGLVTVTARSADAWVELVIEDTGEGIRPEHLAHIFDRFYRADTARNRSHGGTGIGLTITRALVEAHGGIISAESAGVGAGARFTVRLPAGSS